MALSHCLNVRATSSFALFRLIMIIFECFCNQIWKDVRKIDVTMSSLEQSKVTSKLRNHQNLDLKKRIHLKTAWRCSDVAKRIVRVKETFVHCEYTGSTCLSLVSRYSRKLWFKNIDLLHPVFPYQCLKFVENRDSVFQKFIKS